MGAFWLHAADLSCQLPDRSPHLDIQTLTGSVCLSGEKNGFYLWGKSRIKYCTNSIVFILHLNIV